MVAAVVVGAVAVGSAVESNQNKQDAKGAANEAQQESQAATNASITEQEKTLAHQDTLTKPYRDLGDQSIKQYQSLLGLNGADATATLRATPGYQFQQQEGNQQTLNAATATGMGLSGNTLEALSKYNQGLADTTYQQAVGNAEYGVSIGQAAAAGQSAAAGSAGSNISNSLTNQGTTNANLTLNEASSIANYNNKEWNSLSSAVGYFI